MQRRRLSQKESLRLCDTVGKEGGSRKRRLLISVNAFFSAAERHRGSSKSFWSILIIERWSACPPACFQSVRTMCFLRRAR